MSRKLAPPPSFNAVLMWLSPRRRLVWVLVLAALVVAIAPALSAVRRPPVPQPIAFNHPLHTQDLELGCEFCHKYVQSSAHSGLPDEETCSMCHLVELGTSDEAAKLTQMLTGGEPLQFNKLFQLADHVFYTHRRHVGIAELECHNCHGAIADTERPPTRPLVRITMNFCLDCHRERGLTVDCNACHR